MKFSRIYYIYTESFGGIELPSSIREHPAYIMFRPEAVREASRNLAEEEYLFELAVAEGGSFVGFYENEAAVVIGKNQNPWRELSASSLKSGFPKAVRRVSGGGAVYHGRGNLNVFFVVPKEGFSKEGNLDIVRRGLASLGLETERTPRGDLVLEGRKISGNALCYRKDRVLHHATLLVDADLEALRASLSSDGNGVETKAVASVPMSVANLADFRPGLTVAVAAEAVRNAVRDAWGPAPELPLSGSVLRWGGVRVRELAERYEAWDWNYGATPAFAWSPGPGSPVRLSVERGIVVRVEGAGGAGGNLVGKPFDLRTVEDAGW